MSRPFQTDRRLTLRRRTPDGWRIAKDVPRAEPLPWEVAAFRATRTAHVVLLTPPGVDPGDLRSRRCERGIPTTSGATSRATTCPRACS